MTVEDAINELLVEDASVVALVSTRIRLPGNQQSVARPYIVHFAVDAEPTYTHEGEAELIVWGVQVSCFADLYSTVRDLGNKVKAALIGTRMAGSPPQSLEVRWTGLRYEREQETKIHHLAMFFDVSTQIE